MEKNWIILIIVIIVSVAFLFLLILKNHKDKKGLFKKMPGDLPDPPFVEAPTSFASDHPSERPANCSFPMRIVRGSGSEARDTAADASKSAHDHQDDRNRCQ